MPRDDDFQERLDRNEPRALQYQYGHPGAFIREHERAERLEEHAANVESHMVELQLSLDASREAHEKACASAAEFELAWAKAQADAKRLEKSNAGLVRTVERLRQERNQARADADQNADAHDDMESTADNLAAEVQSLLVQRTEWSTKMLELQAQMIAQAKHDQDQLALANSKLSAARAYVTQEQKDESRRLAAKYLEMEKGPVDTPVVVESVEEFRELSTKRADILTGDIIRDFFALSWITRIHVAQDLGLYDKDKDSGIDDAELVKRVFTRAREHGSLPALIMAIEENAKKLSDD
jgi:chromosome segregation ATPase